MSWGSTAGLAASLRPDQRRVPAVGRGLRYANGYLAAAGAGLVWLALLGPVIALLTHLSWQSVTSSLSAPGALAPLAVSAESGGITLVVLVLLGTPLAWALAK